MAKKKDLFEITLSQTEIICFAINYLGEYCRKQHEKIVNAEQSNNEQLATMCKEVAEPWFWKLKKLMELYELQTGKEYSNEFDFIN